MEGEIATTTSVATASDETAQQLQRKKRKIDRSCGEISDSIKCSTGYSGRWSALKFPTEVLVHIFTFTDPRTMVSAMRVNKNWHHHLDSQETRVRQGKQEASCSDRIWSWFYANYFKFGIYRSMFHYPYEPIKWYVLERLWLRQNLRNQIREMIRSYLQSNRRQQQEAAIGGEEPQHSMHTRTLLFHPHLSMGAFQGSNRRAITFEKSGNLLYGRAFVGPAAIGWSPAEVSVFLSDGWMPFTYYVKTQNETVEGGFQAWQATEGFLRKMRSSAREDGRKLSKSKTNIRRELPPLGLNGTWQEVISNAWKKTVVPSHLEFSSLIACYASNSAIQRLYPSYKNQDSHGTDSETSFRSFPLTAFALRLQVFPLRGNGADSPEIKRSQSRINVDTSSNTFGYSKTALALLRYDSKLQFLPRSLQVSDLWKRLTDRMFPGFSAINEEPLLAPHLSTHTEEEDRHMQSQEHTGFGTSANTGRAESGSASDHSREYAKFYCSPAIGFSFRGTLANSLEHVGTLRYELSRGKDLEQRALHAHPRAPSLLSEAFESRYRVPTNCVLEQEFRKTWTLTENNTEDGADIESVTEDILRLLVEGWGITLTGGLTDLHIAT
eukprot:gb/GECG01007614.1/.p1 GENE.gb/GECG01007614.1/~~gb/GECG01007614.1/.p1  ORF type:complete len:608 (+),score=63.03 gb/GECG01007614.1/:1-1824(+)